MKGENAMKIEHNFPYDIDDINAYDVAEMVANSDATEQANFFEHLAYNLFSYGDTKMSKNTKLSHIVKEIYVNDDIDRVRWFLEKMLEWFDYYEKEFNEE